MALKKFADQGTIAHSNFGTFITRVYKYLGYGACNMLSYMWQMKPFGNKIWIFIYVVETVLFFYTNYPLDHFQARYNFIQKKNVLSLCKKKMQVQIIHEYMQANFVLDYFGKKVINDKF